MVESIQQVFRRAKDAVNKSFHQMRGHLEQRNNAAFSATRLAEIGNRTAISRSQNHSSPISVLLDLSTIRFGVLTQYADVPRTIRWGDKAQTLNLAGWQGKPDRSHGETWLKEQIQCLPTIAQLAKDGALKLYFYNELRNEELRGRRGMRGTFGDLFAGIPLSEIRPAIERTRFQGKRDFSDYLSKEAQIEFCRFLISIPSVDLLKNTEYWSVLPEFERTNLFRIEEFQRLCKGLTENHFADAFHLWTAEVNEIDYLLMVETPFVNAVKQSSNLGFHCKPIAPSDFLDELGVGERVPLPFIGSPPRAFYE